MSVNAGFEEIARGAGAVAAAALAESAEEQLELILGQAPPTRLTGGQAEAVREQMAAAARVRGRIGRPPGAQNKLTQEAKRWITRVVGDPLVESARWLLHTPASMAAELSCTVLEAFSLQQRIREGLLPYMHSKMAPVGEDGRAIPLFQLVMGGAEELSTGPIAPWLSDPEVMRTLALEDQQNQGVSEAELELSQTSGSQK